MSDPTPIDEARRTLAPVITWRTTLVTSVDCSTCKLVGLVLSLYMNERGGSAFPSVPTLAADCSLSDSTVREHLNAHLHTQGWLTLIERGGQSGQRRRANEWQASTPPGAGGVPHREDSQPHRETASTPPGDGAQVVHEQVQEVVTASSLNPFHCPTPVCDRTFPDTVSRDDHYENCGDPDFIPADAIAAPVRTRG